eukprot:CAMPEP_0119026098 /NCGR_PEP_ID=MMETSP1176-20130426/34858_1 /TAXON_ID=265551 /ORGANISM="Synedropsis recta cf, Strain CCMP1620" /LENGTH=93 /DNA_ID=CAMNT_0006981755 /DNA_START=45 /DNA_END=326 /DNA_ORIENTATION=+
MKGGSAGGGNNNNTDRAGDNHIDHLWARIAARQQDRTSSQGEESSSSATFDPLSSFLEHAIALSSNSLEKAAKQEAPKRLVAQETAGSSTDRK